LLEIAAASDVVHTADARRLADQNPGSTSGGPQWHLAQLEAAHLLRRRKRGEYELTPLAKQLLTAVGVRIADNDSVPGAGSTRATVVLEGPAAEALLPPGAELVAALTQLLPSGEVIGATIRLSG
jgi:hypothetical protein